MTEPTTIFVAVACLLLAIGIGVLFLPRPPTLDAERWFKLWIATLLRGRHEADDPDRWVASVLRFVPYHPAGRLPEQKLLRPSQFALSGPALDGELALVAALAKLTTVRERLTHMYQQDEPALDAILDDPDNLGADYKPDRWLGPEATWDAVSEWADTSGVVEQGVRRSAHTWVLVHGAGSPVPDLLTALADVLGDAAVAVPWLDVPPPVPDGPTDKVRAEMLSRRGDEDFVNRASAVIAEVRRVAPGLSDRVVVVAADRSVQVAMEALVSDAEIRDRLAAVVSIGGVIQGLDGEHGPWSWAACTDWLQANFTHKALDLEMNRRVPWMAMQWMDPDAEHLGAAGVPLERQRMVAPMDRGGEHDWVEVEDLGPLPADPDLPIDIVARALIGLVTCWVASRT